MKRDHLLGNKTEAALNKVAPCFDDRWLNPFPLGMPRRVQEEEKAFLDSLSSVPTRPALHIEDNHMTLGDVAGIHAQIEAVQAGGNPWDAKQAPAHAALTPNVHRMIREGAVQPPAGYVAPAAPGTRAHASEIADGSDNARRIANEMAQAYVQARPGLGNALQALGNIRTDADCLHAIRHTAADVVGGGQRGTHTPAGRHQLRHPKA